MFKDFMSTGEIQTEAGKLILQRYMLSNKYTLSLLYKH